MRNKKYVVGIDFGTLSGRSVIVDVSDGKEICEAVKSYTHGVIDEFLPDGRTKLPTDYALQHPADYLEVLQETIPSLLAKSGISADDIIGVGVNFTSSTILPIKNDGTPLCLLEEYSSNPHSYVKLWKHHAAQPEADRINELATQRGESFLKRYGNKISCEWLFPKVFQVLKEAPDIYEAADKFIEAGDWIILKLSGKECRSSCLAGYKGMWSKREGYPSKEFLALLDPKLENLVEEKLDTKVYSLGSKAGEITHEASLLTGLKSGTAVSVSIIDAHAAVPAVGITEPGKLLMIMGTSTCHLILGTEEMEIPGVCGVVEDGIIPGLIGYEAGQACVGDHFDWFVKNCVPASYIEEAKNKGINIHKLLRDKASAYKPGQTGLLVLDWWNGNRSVLMDTNLTGLIIGFSLLTKPEEIYRALIEATSFGTKMIIDTMVDNGIPIDEIYATGGIAEKDEFMMQIYADVINLDIKVSLTPQTAALGSAMFGAVAAGKVIGGYATIGEASKAMSDSNYKLYSPKKENVKAYSRLYSEYKSLHDYFGRNENGVMGRLKMLKTMLD